MTTRGTRATPTREPAGSGTALALLGLRGALPPRSVDQARAAELARRWQPLDDERERQLSALYRRSGVGHRHSVLAGGGDDPDAPERFYGPARPDRPAGPTTRERMERYEREAAPLAERAARAALAEARCDAAAITHVVTVSCTGFSAPGVDASLIRALELSPEVQRAHVGFMGCHGALNGLRVAGAFAAADPAARVLVAAVELCTLHFYYGWDAGKVVANALFADGAAAAVCAAAPGGTAWAVSDFGSCVFPESEGDMTWRIGDAGFEMSLSARVPDLIGAHLRPWLTRWLAARGVRFEDVGSWAVHPGGPRILDAVRAALELPREATSVSREILRERGNMSSPTILMILEALRAADAPRPVVALGFGPGLAVEAALVR